MNFEVMPELRWRWSYPVLWSVLIIVGGAMVLYFKKKKWF
jgi:magnesium transporter